MNSINWHFVDTPACRHSRPSVERRLQIAAQANQCVKWLEINGFEVICISKEILTPPRIIIRNSPLCNELDGVAMGYERNKRGSKHYRFVMRFDCEVRWEILTVSGVQECTCIGFQFTFYLARLLARTVAELDEINIMLTEYGKIGKMIQTKLLAFNERLNDVAEKLAGSRRDEIYGKGEQ